MTFRRSWEWKRNIRARTEQLQVNFTCLIHCARALMRLKPSKEGQLSACSTQVVELCNTKGASQEKSRCHRHSAWPLLSRRLLIWITNFIAICLRSPKAFNRSFKTWTTKRCIMNDQCFFFPMQNGNVMQLLLKITQNRISSSPPLQLMQKG